LHEFDNKNDKFLITHLIKSKTNQIFSADNSITISSFVIPVKQSILVYFFVKAHQQHYLLYLDHSDWISCDDDESSGESHLCPLRQPNLKNEIKNSNLEFSHENDIIHKLKVNRIKCTEYVRDLD